MGRLLSPCFCGLIALVAPEPTLVVRPRLYEPKPDTLTAGLQDVLKAIDVVYVQSSPGWNSLSTAKLARS